MSFRVLSGLLTVTVLIALCGCDLAKDTAGTSQGGAEGAAGIAGKMSEGTLGSPTEDGDGEVADGE